MFDMRDLILSFFSERSSAYARGRDLDSQGQRETATFVTVDLTGKSPMELQTFAIDDREKETDLQNSLKNSHYV